VELTIDARFRGPSDSGNGGYTCGVVARHVGDPAEVTLRLPPPLDRSLRVEQENGRVAVYDGDALVAEARPAVVELDVPAPVTFAEAQDAAARYPGFEEHAFPSCFVCGPAREPGDGLRIFASPVPGRDVLAAPWVPAADLTGDDGTVRPEIVWAALDCPGAFAVGFIGRGEIVLGRLAARIDRVPAAGERYVVIAWPLGEDGRKLYAGTALFSEAGTLHAVARATWIEPRAPGA
jgi:hypothetical protein